MSSTNTDNNNYESDFRIAVLEGQKIYYDDKDPNSVFFKLIERVWQRIESLQESVDVLEEQVAYLYKLNNRDYNED